MSQMSPVSAESLHLLSAAVVAHADGQDIRTRTTMLSLCIEAVAFGLEAEAGQAGTRARDAAHLMLELARPELGDVALHELSVACERAATRP
jgi:hypothetical protein